MQKYVECIDETISSSFFVEIYENLLDAMETFVSLFFVTNMQKYNFNFKILVCIFWVNVLKTF